MIFWKDVNVDNEGGAIRGAWDFEVNSTIKHMIIELTPKKAIET